MGAQVRKQLLHPYHTSCTSAMSSESLLAAGRRSAPGRGFKAKVDGRWQDYASQCNQLLLEAYAAGCPSMRLNVKGQMYKFDFEKMEQRNLVTLETSDMRAPHDAQRPTRNSLFDVANLRHPRSRGRKSLQDAVHPQRPVFVVRVPEDGPGSTIRVPHPKKLGKAMAVAVPCEAKVGQPLFLPMPRTQMKTKLKYAAGGAAAGTTGAAMGVAIGQTAGGAAAGGALATVGTVAAVGLAGVAVAGVVVAAGAGVHYAVRNPGKAAVIGALTVGGLALASHAAEVGVVEAAGDVAEGAGDFVEAAADAAGDGIDIAEDFAEDLVDTGDWVGDFADDTVDIIAELF